MIAKAMETYAQLKLAGMLIKKAIDMRMSHRHRSSMIKYAREVLRAHEVHDKRLMGMNEILVILENNQYDQRLTHTEIKVVLGAVHDLIVEVKTSYEPVIQERASERDIPF